MANLRRYLDDTTQYLADGNRAAAAAVVIRAAREAATEGWKPPPGWDRMTTRQRLDALPGPPGYTPTTTGTPDPRMQARPWIPRLPLRTIY